MTSLLPNYTPTPTQPTTFYLGTGTSIYSSLLPQLLSTNHQLIIVTCFWASSSSQQDIHQLLLRLSRRATAEQRTIHIRICFSSLSPLQKIFDTASTDGHLYAPSRYASLGLPSETEIPGLDVRIKSIFFRPCHVLHGKYIIQDERRVWFPSCNVSWEAWGEGCIGFEGGGGLVSDLKGYWSRIWDGDGTMGIPEIIGTTRMAERSREGPMEMGDRDASLLASIDLSHLPADTETLLLPHTHSRYNPFSVIFHPNAKTPITPLNTFLLSHISTAKSSIKIYTPNLTYKPIINALFEALSRGVHVRIVASRNLMRLEQLVTAGTLTEWEVWKMRRRYRRLASPPPTSTSRRVDDLEASTASAARVGNLDIFYFRPPPAHVHGDDANHDNANATANANPNDNANARTEGILTTSRRNINAESRPVKLHLKMTIIDDAIAVLGSGNMDRASWVTSQELGVAIFSEDVSRSLGAVARRVYG
ncbi:hypothetical protein DSL72_006186 [Monilinia vaccinii-corymbosi]|uniref:PLD phosphodiesterase domain-containing protein n=1 Tax=Monilinia vaccinii-corymbosi TaxID=61207 RepID=A0A8A3PH13_9HELO|nr:hypothetical protein DSL72_006186 [Monilinia vaccinii-corymbosi]